MFEWIELFSSLNESELKTLELFCQDRFIEKWEILFEEWEEANSMYVVKSWLLEAYVWDEVLWSINPWECVWEMAIFEWHNKRTASVRALEDTSMIVFVAFSIEDLAKKHPSILNSIKEVILKRRKQNHNIG